jgi:hypothetical protein
MAARSRAKTSSRSTRSSGGGLRSAINDLVGALPVGRLTQRLALLERTVSRLEREARRLLDAASAPAPRRQTATRRTTATTRQRAVAKSTTRQRAKGGAAAKPATRRRAAATAASTTRTRSKPTGAAAKPATRRRTARTSPSAPAERSEIAPLALTPPEPAPFASLAGEESAAETASQDLSAFASPQGPGPLPAV